jgi:hypothetical protein
MTIADKTVLVTGASREAPARNARWVYATRRPLAHPDPRVTPLMLNVTNPAQIQRAGVEVESPGTLSPMRCASRTGPVRTKLTLVHVGAPRPT